MISECKPPNKLFDNGDINSRSGGEKTIAGLALLFSMAHEKKVKPPMILLDEVDAHLDPDNVELLSAYLEKWSKKEDSPQLLMISHKEQAVEKTDSLIGVTQQEYFRMPADDNQGLDSSKFVSATTYSLDLRKLAS